MKFRIGVTSISAMLFLSGCGQADMKKEAVSAVDTNKAAVSAVDTNKVKAENALKAAKEANKKAANAGFDWNVTYDYIKESEKLLGEGNYKGSMEVSDRVNAYAKIGLEQAIASKIAAPRYLK